MFDNREEQLADLNIAYDAFLQTARGLSSEAFHCSLGDWTPRDIVAHFIGWNRITLVGCGELREGAEPFYFYDGTNDYRKINAKFLRQFDSRDRDALLEEMAATKETLVAFLKSIADADWEADTSIVHYRGGTATVARCVDSLVRDYRKHREEILAAQGSN